MHGEGRGRERWEVGPAVVVACERQSARGVQARVRYGGDGGGVGVCAECRCCRVRVSEARERERGGGRAGDVDATMCWIYAKERCLGWIYRMDKCWEEIKWSSNDLYFLE
jgi:hypothetical protein